MAWEYLENLDYRYKDVAQFVTDDDAVFELNSGNSRLREYVKNHICNDLYDPRADYQLTDKEFSKKVDKCDVLVCLGIGGHEITGERLESPTITDTLIEIANRLKPRLVILECVEKFASIADRIIKDTDYDIVNTIKTNKGDWLHNRVMYICKT